VVVSWKQKGTVSKGVGLQPTELLKNTIIDTFLRYPKENGLLISCKYSMNWWLF
jgi:hypothetical protein